MVISIELVLWLMNDCEMCLKHGSWFSDVNYYFSDDYNCKLSDAFRRLLSDVY